MNYFDCVDKMYYISDPNPPLVAWDAEKKRIISLNETTSMDAVSFLPSHLGMVKADISGLAKKKKDWKIEILEQDEVKEITFEDSYRIKVPNEHWDSFCSMFDNVPENNSYLNLNSLLNETMEEEMKDLRRELRVALANLYDESEFEKLEESASTWRWRFGVTGYSTRSKVSAPVTYENRRKDIQNLYDRLVKFYGEDRGNLEMLIEALKNKDPLNTFNIFKNYDYLYGTRMHSKYHGVRLYFECLVDTNYHTTETIYSPDDDLMGKISEESQEVKVVRHVIYPKGGVFTPRFLRLLSDTIEDLDSEEE